MVHRWRDKLFKDQFVIWYWPDRMKWECEKLREKLYGKRIKISVLGSTLGTGKIRNGTPDSGDIQKEEYECIQKHFSGKPTVIKVCR